MEHVQEPDDKKQTAELEHDIEIIQEEIQAQAEILHGDSHHGSGSDPVTLEQLRTESTDTETVLAPDGQNGVQWIPLPAAARGPEGPPGPAGPQGEPGPPGGLNQEPHAITHSKDAEDAIRVELLGTLELEKDLVLATDGDGGLRFIKPPRGERGPRGQKGQRGEKGEAGKGGGGGSTAQSPWYQRALVIEPSETKVDVITLSQFVSANYIMSFVGTGGSRRLNFDVLQNSGSLQDTVYAKVGLLDIDITATISGDNMHVNLTNNESFTVTARLLRSLT